MMERYWGVPAPLDWGSSSTGLLLLGSPVCPATSRYRGVGGYWAPSLLWVRQRVLQALKPPMHP